jgi:DNA polymerase-1
VAEIIDTGSIRASQSFDPDTTSWIYNGLDCCVTAEVYQTLIPLLDEQTSAIYTLSKGLQGPILDMNMHGLLVDQVTLHETIDQLNATIAGLEAQLNRILRDGYGVEFSWSSPKQVTAFLYDYLRLPIQWKRSANGARVPTSDRKALEKLEAYLVVRPFCKHVLLIRDLAKQLSFLRTPLDHGYLRTSFNIAGTVTGRLASSFDDFGTGTNLQNVNRLLRKMFVAPAGKKLATLDLEQGDSRNVGALCWNRFLSSHGADFAGAYLDACESSDLHTAVTRMSRPELAWPEDPTHWRAFAEAPRPEFRGKSYRDTSKNWGHGSNYLLTPASAAEKIPGATIQSATEFRARYFSAFPCIPEWHKAVAASLREDASLHTLLGRRRYFFGRLDDDKTIRDGVAYEGQGSTSDEINHGMLRLWREGKRFPGFQLLVQVHDSVTFEYDQVCENEIIPWAVETLRVPVTLAGGRDFVVPTEAKIGWNWGDHDEGSNPDGHRKWKGGDSRIRSVPARLHFLS